MLRNSELKTLVKQLNKPPRTSVLKEGERETLKRELAEVQPITKETKKENRKVARIDKNK